VTTVRISRRELSTLVGLAGARLESGLTDLLTGSATEAAHKVFAALEPDIRTIAREEIAPQVAIALGSSVLLGVVIAALIGSWFASRVRRSS
jgi:hypothetical protein